MLYLIVRIDANKLIECYPRRRATTSRVGSNDPNHDNEIGNPTPAKG